MDQGAAHQWGQMMPWSNDRPQQDTAPPMDYYASNNAPPVDPYAPVDPSHAYWQGRAENASQYPEPQQQQYTQQEPQQYAAQQQELEDMRNRFMALKMEHSKVCDAKAAAEEQMQALNGHYTNLHEQYTALQGQNQQLQNDYQTIEGNLKEEDEQVNKLIEELKLARDEAVQHRQVTGDKLRRMRVENTDLRDAKRTLEDQLRYANQQIELLKSQGPRQDTGNGTLQRENQDLRDANKAMEEPVQRLTADGMDRSHANRKMRSTGDQVGFLQKENGDLRDVKLALTEQLREANQRLAKEEANREEFANKNEELREANLALKAEAQAANQEHKRQEEKLWEANLERKTLDAKVAEMQRSQDEAKAKLQDAARQVKDIEDAVEQLKAQNEHLRSANESAHERAADMQKKFLSVQTNQDLMQEQLERAEGGLAGLQSENALLQQDKTLLEVQLKEERKALEQIRPLNRAMHNELEALKAEQSAKLNLASTNEQQLNAAQELIGALEAKLKVAAVFGKHRAASRGLKDDCEEKKDSVDEELMEELVRAQSVNAKAQGELQTVLEHDLLELKAAHQTMQGELREANDEIVALEAGMDDMATLRKELAELKRSNHKTATDKEAIESLLETTRDRTKAANAEASEALQELEQLRAKVEEAEVEREGTQKMLDRKSDELQMATQSLAKMETEIEPLKSQHQSLVNKHEDAQRELQDLSQQLVASQKTKQELEDVVDGYQTMISQLEAETGAVVEYQQKIEGDVQSLTAERANLQQALDEMGAELRDIQDALKKSESLAEKYSATIKQLESDVDRLGEEKDTIDSDRNNLKKEHAKDLHSLKSELDEKGRLETEKDEMVKKQTKDLQALKSECGDLRTKCDSMSTELEEAKYEAKKLQTLDDRHRKKASTLEAEVAECRDENEALENKQRKHAKAMATLKLERDELDSDLQKLKGELRGRDETQNKLKAFSRTVADLEAQTARLESQRSETAKQLGDAKSERDKQKGLLERTARDLETSTASKSSLESALMQELSELRACPSMTERDVRQAIGSLKSEMASSEQKLREASQAKESLMRDLNEAQDRVSRLTRQNDDLSKCWEEVNKELEPTRRENDQMRKRIASLDSSEQTGSRALANFLDRPASKRDEAAALNRQLDERTQELTSLQNRYEDLGKAHHGLVKATREAAVALSNQLEDRNQEFDDLQRKFKKVNSEHVRTKEKLRKLEDEDDEKEQSLERLEQKLAEAKKDINKLKPDREKLLLELEEACAARDSAQESQKAQETFIGNLRDRHKSEGDAKNEKIERLAKDLLSAENSLGENERNLDEMKSKLRQMALEKRNQNKEYIGKAAEDEKRISKLEAQLDGSRQAYTEATTTRADIDAQLKSAEAGMTDLMQTLAYVENDYNARDSESQMAYKNLLDRAAKLESQLPIVMQEKERLENEGNHVRGKLRQAMSANSAVQASCDKAETDLMTVSHELSKIVRPHSTDGAEEPSGKDPLGIVAKVKAVLGDAIDDREEAVNAKEALQEDMEEKEQSFAREKERLMKELTGLEATVEQVSGENRQLLKRFQSKLVDAEGQGERLQSKLKDAEGQGDRLNEDLATAKRAQEGLRDENTALKKKLGEATTAVRKLKEKAANQSRVGKNIADFRAENKALQESLDKALAAIKEMEESAKQVQGPEERTYALELTLKDRDHRLKDVLKELQQKDAENAVLHNDARKLKWFLEQFLGEAKELVGVLQEAVADPELDRLNDSLDSSRKSVLERLEGIVKHFETEFIEDRNEPPQDSLAGRELEGDEARMSPAHSEHADASSTREPFESSIPSAKIGRLDRQSQKTVPTKTRAPFRLNLPAPIAHRTVSPRYRPTRHMPSLAASSGGATKRNQDQAAYVQKRLAESIAAAAPRAHPGKRKDASREVSKHQRSYHERTPTKQRTAKSQEPQAGSLRSLANSSVSGWHGAGDASRSAKSFADPPTTPSVDVTASVKSDMETRRSKLDRVRWTASVHA